MAFTYRAVVLGGNKKKKMKNFAVRACSSLPPRFAPQRIARYSYV